MDAFTENILVRARERQRMLKEYPTAGGAPLKECNRDAVSEPNLAVAKVKPAGDEAQSEPNIPFRVAQAPTEMSESKFTRQNSITRVCSDIQGSPGQQTKTLNIQRDDFNMEIKVNSSENVRLEVEIEERSEDGSQGSESNFGLREESKNRLKRLGKLYAGGVEADISSPIHRTEAKFYQALEEDIEKENCSSKQDVKVKKGLSRLAALANTINQWEDDLSHPSRPVQSSPRKTWKPQAPPPPQSVQNASPQKVQKGKAPSPPNTGTASPKKVLFAETKTKSEESTALEGQSRGAVPKQLNWDRKVLDTLDTSESKEQKSQKPLQSRSNTIQEEDSDEPKPDSPCKNFRSNAIANRAAMFEKKIIQSPSKPEKDPALLSLAARKALFEKNKGEALIPKAAFGMSAPVKVDTTTKACESKFIGASKNTTAQVHTKKIVSPKSKPAPPPPMSKAPPTSTTTAPTIAVVHQAGGIASKMAALLENKSTISEEQITNKLKEERQKELDMLLNRFNKNKEVAQKDEDEIQEVSESSEDEEVDERTAMIKDSKPPAIVATSRKSGEKRKSGSRLSTEADSPQVVSVLDEVKRIKVTAPKPGRLYPNLSDIEATTTDQDTRTPTPNEENRIDENYDSDDPNTSFGRDIMQAVCKNITPTKRVTYKDSSSSSENSCVMDELDEILEEMDDDSSSGPTPPKLGRHQSPKIKKPQPSNSFHYKSFTSTSPGNSSTGQKFQSPKKSIISPRQSMELPLVVDGDHVMTLTHTVSFYRKQQNEVHTPVRQIIRQPIIEEVTEGVNSTDSEVQAKIRTLEEEVNKQQNIIAQTSQALNLCSSTPEFSGSTEQVEAERVLLVATHRRQAALHELQRLKVEGAIRPVSEHSQNVPLEKGTLTISNIVLPLKQKYVTALAAAGGKGHHVVCLIKCGEQVVATKLVSTVASNSKNPDVDLYVPGTVTLNNIYSDFTVTFEVYCLQAHEECLPHEVKYHINKKPSKGLATPKKSKQESKLVRPPIESPGGPNAVRSSSFAVMGYVVFSVQAVNKRVWSLNNTPAMSPLEGSVEMRISCQLAVSVEHRGFLTMFEDVSGFGAWHRRWCLLKGHSLSYWKYPEDEKKTPPIDTIDLKSCITKKVGPVSREICARLHTFLVERERPAYPQDKDTLVVVRKGDKTIIRHLLSADTKEERIEWCSKLNAALTALRMWGQQ